MKILVTGSCGFIGQNFVRMYKDEHEIIGFDAKLYAHDWRAVSLCKTIEGNIANKDDVNNLFKTYGPFDAIINFAAESHVDNSIKSPRPFINNFLGTFELLERFREYNYGRFLQVSCYDTETRILTENGFKSYEELSPGENIFSINNNGEIEKDIVEKIIVQKYNGNMIKFKTNRSDVFVTPNHRMLFQKADNSVQEIEAKEAIKKDGFCFPRGIWNGFNAETINVDGIGECDAESLMYVIGVYVGDGMSSFNQNKKQCLTGLDRKDFLCNGRDNKTGRFKSIGKIGEKEYSICSSWRIFFDVPEKDKGRKRLEQSLTKLGIKWYPEKNKSGEHIFFSGKHWYSFFQQFGKHALYKHIPDNFLVYSSRLLKALYDGLIDSDGHGQHFYTISKKLVENSCEIGLKIGLFPRFSIKKQKESLYENRIIMPKHVLYDVSFRQENITFGKKSSNIINYDGEIWCPVISKNKNLIMERKGILFFCGNTDEVYGDLQKDDTAFFNLCELKPSSPYSASKASSDLLVLSYARTYGMNVVITRSCNNYGRFQYKEKLLPVIILNALKDNKIPVYGQGLNQREWIYVKDNCEGIMSALIYGKSSGIYNLGSGTEIKNIDMVKMILDIMGKPHSLISFVEDRKGHDFRYFMDSSISNKELSWSAKTSLEVGLEKTINWFTSNPNYWEI